MVRIAVVTGAAGGMGRAISQKLVDDGLQVVGIDLAEPGIDLHPGDQVSFKQCDLTDPAQTQSTFDEIAAEHGGIDVLVNNAGTCLMSEFPHIPAKELADQMAINFNSAFYCCQAGIKLMQGRDGVRKIINISSNGAYNFDVFDPPHYRASKAALDTLTKDLARRYARERICVNSIAPAMTETPLFGVVSADVLEDAIAKMPHGTAMKPDEIAAWVSFLASPAGDVCSGNVIILNQGRDVR